MSNLTITNEVEYEYAKRVIEAFAESGYSTPVSDMLARRIEEYEDLSGHMRQLEDITDGRNLTDVLKGLMEAQRGLFD